MTRGHGVEQSRAFRVVRVMLCVCESLDVKLDCIVKLKTMLYNGRVWGVTALVCFGVAVPSGGWLGSRTEEGRAKLR